jgi:hypothetical protein
MEDSPHDDPFATREILITFYRENALQSRHYDQQRQIVTSTVALAAALVLGLALLAPPGAANLPAGLLLIALGGFGFLACIRHHERARLHVERVHAVREEISNRFSSHLLDLYAVANQKHARRFPFLSEKTARVHFIWLGFHAAVAALGLLLLVSGV